MARARGKRDRQEVRRFLGDLDRETAQLVADLQSGEFRFQAYRAFAIQDPKTRIIHAPSFRDRVVHHAIIAVAGPVFERGALDHSYACRTGRGLHAALAQLRRWVRPGDWFFHGDIAKYYDSMPHHLLRQQLARRFRERRFLALLDRLLDSYAARPGPGLPIGALTSQYLGNFFLDVFDHWIRHTGKAARYLRYMDDILILGERAVLDRLRVEIPAVLEGLGLRLKRQGNFNRVALGIPYLGFVTYPERVRLNHLGRRRLRRKLATLERSWHAGNCDELELQARGTALFARARWADDVAWRRVVAGFSRFGEMQGPQPRPARRLVEQQGQEVPLGVPQQEEAG